MSQSIKNSIKKTSYFYALLVFIHGKCFFNVKSLVRYFNDRYFSLTYYNNLSLVRACHITVGIKYLFLKRTLIPHPVGIVIGKNVVLGSGCTIYQNVTIGVRNNNEEKYPALGDNVIVYANACIIGDIKIGSNVIIGSGSLVNKDIPDNAIVRGSPAVVIRFQK